MMIKPRSWITLLPSWLPELFISGCSFRAWIRSWVCYKNIFFNNSNIFSELFTWSTSTSLSSSTLRMTTDQHQRQQEKKLVHCFRTNILFKDNTALYSPMAEVELDNVRENGVKMSVETKQNNLRDHILSWISQKGKTRILRNAQNIVNIYQKD